LAPTSGHGADGENGCDFDAVAGQCTFRVSICLLARDKRFRACARSRTPLDSVSVSVIDPRGSGLPDGGATRVALDSLSNLPGADVGGSGVRFEPPLRPERTASCSLPFDVVVPVAGEPGTRRLTVVSEGTGGRNAPLDQSSISLRCLSSR
jgi:hypothetical protein